MWNSKEQLLDIKMPRSKTLSEGFMIFIFGLTYRLSPCIIRTPLLQLKSVGEVDIYVSVYNPHPYFTAIGAVHAWPNTNVTPHKLTFKPGYHIHTFFLCHIFMYTGIYFCVAVIYNEYLWVFSKLF